MRRSVSSSGIATTFSCTKKSRAKLGSKLSIWSGDSGVTKHLANLLRQLEEGSGTTVVSSWQGMRGALQLCRKALFAGVGRSRYANSQILHKGSLP